MGWAQNYPGLDSHLHELGTYLTDHPGTSADSMSSIAEAVQKFFTSDMTGSSSKLEYNKPEKQESTAQSTTAQSEPYPPSQQYPPSQPPPAQTR